MIELRINNKTYRVEGVDSFANATYNVHPADFVLLSTAWTGRV